MQKSVPLRNAIKIFCLQNVVCGIIIVWYKIWWQSLWHAGITAADAAFGRGTGPILVHFVRCTGTESSLLSCSHSGNDYYYYYRYRYCSYYNDAGVVCPSCKLHRRRNQWGWSGHGLTTFLTCWYKAKSRVRQAMSLSHPLLAYMYAIACAIGIGTSAGGHRGAAPTIRFSPFRVVGWGLTTDYWPLTTDFIWYSLSVYCRASSEMSDAAVAVRPNCSSAQHSKVIHSLHKHLSPLFWAAVIMGLITTIASLTTTSSITSVLIIVMLELSAPHVSNVFGCLAPIYRFSPWTQLDWC